MSATPSTRICAFCTRLVMLSRDKNTVAKHTNVKGICGGSGRTVEEHDRVKKALSVPVLPANATPAVRAPTPTPKPRPSVPRKRGTS